jgi:hypothetical protein
LSTCSATRRSNGVERERVEPRVQRVDRHLARRADRRAAHAHAQRLGLELGAAARGHSCAIWYWRRKTRMYAL